MPVESRIHHLIINDGAGPVVVRVEFTAPITRRVGIWPQTVMCNIVEPELALFPVNRSTVTVDIKIGTDASSVLIKGWRVVMVKPTLIGNTPDNLTDRPLAFQMTLEDERRQINGDRGGTLLHGLVNRLDPQGVPIPKYLKPISVLVQACINEIPLTYREEFLPPELVASLNQFEPPSELEWFGIPAPVELQRLLEYTGHVFIFNRDGTYSIKQLTAPHQPHDQPAIDPALKRPGAAQTIAPRTPRKVVIGSCPTRVIVQRRRRITGEFALQWVGVDTDNSIKRLTDLSWWPIGKTPIEVLNANYRHVQDEHRDLAVASIFKMLRLSDDDLSQGWALARRLVDQYELSRHEDDINNQPITCRLLAKIAVPDGFGYYTTQGDIYPVKDVSFDLETGVLRTSTLLVQVWGRQPGAVELNAIEITAFGDLRFDFAHLPSIGLTGPEVRNDENYFLQAYEWDLEEGAIETPGGRDALLAALADGGDVPLYNFDSLQLLYLERDDGTFEVDAVNLAQVKSAALRLAKALVTDGNASVEYAEYHGLHNIDTNGSINEVTWHHAVNITSVKMGYYHASQSIYNELLAMDRQAKGGAVGSNRTAQTRGMLNGRSGATGPASGAGSVSRQAVAPLPGGGGDGGGGRQGTWGRGYECVIDSFVLSGPNVWTYTVSEIYKRAAGFGADKWTAPPLPATVAARNRFENKNAATGMLGIQVTVAELDACGQKLRPIQAGTIVEVRDRLIYEDDGSVGTEYEFAWPNSVEDK